MRLGISSYTFNWAVGTGTHKPANGMTAIDLVDRAKQMGVGLLQICDNLPEATYTPASVAAIAEHARRQGIAMELGTRGCQPDHLRRFIAYAETLGSPILRVVTDKDGDEPSVEEVIARFSSLADECRRAGVVIAIENHDRLKAKQLAAIAAALPATAGICLDTVNSMGALEGPEVVVETLGPYTVNLHLKDFAVVRRATLMGFQVEGRAPGTGMLDIPWVLQKLKSFGRDCNAIVEMWPPAEATLAQSMALENEWAESGIRRLRRWIPD